MNSISITDMLNQRIRLNSICYPEQLLMDVAEVLDFSIKICPLHYEQELPGIARDGSHFFIAVERDGSRRFKQLSIALAFLLRESEEPLIHSHLSVKALLNDSAFWHEVDAVHGIIRSLNMNHLFLC